jgi:hypothetical protein
MCGEKNEISNVGVLDCVRINSLGEDFTEATDIDEDVLDCVRVDGALKVASESTEPAERKPLVPGERSPVEPGVVFKLRGDALNRCSVP